MTKESKAEPHWAYELGYELIHLLKREVPRMLLYGFVTIWWVYHQWGWRPPG